MIHNQDTSTQLLLSKTDSVKKYQYYFYFISQPILCIFFNKRNFRFPLLDVSVYLYQYLKVRKIEIPPAEKLNKIQSIFLEYTLFLKLPLHLQKHMIALSFSECFEVLNSKNFVQKNLSSKFLNLGIYSFNQGNVIKANFQNKQL